MTVAYTPEGLQNGRTVSFDKLSLGKAAKPNAAGDIDIDAELARFEAEARAELGLDQPTEQYVEHVARDFQAKDRAHTTILVSGLTMAHDYFVQGALSGLGYNIRAMDVADYDALRYGKEFGNRGQCNPTYFTVGNLIKHLSHLRDGGMSTEEIIKSYVFLTAGACGPCRFGMYVTEYRKALRDAGFDGFRVLLFQQQGGLKQATGEEEGLRFDQPFFLGLVKALFIGDALNAISYRVRPYELVAGATDHALAESKRHIHDALKNQTSIVVAMWKVRREFSKVKVDKLRVRPKVGIIGEFWAMTTEGDGNYKMPKFLQEEGAEVDVQLVTAWIIFMIWENMRDTQHRMTLRQDDGARKGLEGKEPTGKIWKLRGAEIAVRGLFQGWANMMGLHGYHLPDMFEVAEVAKDFYNNDLRGGEAHMEVGKLILNVVKSKVNMTLSVKPFGCMPSSGVSDGVQSAITELYPEAIFLPIETTGDGAVNVQSRVQMMLFKAKAHAQREKDSALERYGMTEDEVRQTLERFPILGHPLMKAPHRNASTAADTVELVGMVRHPLRALKIAAERRKSQLTLRKGRHVHATAAAAA